MEAWIRTIPAEILARRGEPIVVEWGFAAGPACAAMHVDRCDPPRSLDDVLPMLFDKRGTFRRAHVALIDGMTLWFAPNGYVAR